MSDLESVDRLIPREVYEDEGSFLLLEHDGMNTCDCRICVGIRNGVGPVDVVAVKFVLDSIIDFLEEVKLSGESLRHAGQLLHDVEALRREL